MADRSGDVEFVRSDGSPLVDEDIPEKNVLAIKNNDDEGGGRDISGSDILAAEIGDEEADLPQCKIKRNYSCSLCPFFSQNPRSFLYHSRDVHFDRIKIFECSQCLYASKHSQKLQRHINMIHVAGKNRTKRASKGIKVERKKEFRPIKPKPIEPLLEFDSAKNVKQEELDSTLLENFLKTDTEDTPQVDSHEMINGEFKCSVCNFKNKNQKLMRRHEKIVHLKKRFLRCSKCSYVTHVKARYTKHVKYHSMPMIKCDLCDFRTPYKWNLDRHYKNHCGTGAFQCSKCNFRADIKQSLTVHEMNHHVPPVGQGAIMARKKNKVGASEATALEYALETQKLHMQKIEQECPQSGNDEGEIKEEENSDKQIFKNIRNVKIPYINKRESANNNHFQTDFIDPDDIVPRYGQIYVKNLKCKFCSYKAVFSHEIWRHEKRIHGYVRAESKKENVQKRPPPKLIPIQNKTNSSNPILSPILKIPAVKSKAAVQVQETLLTEKSVNENEFNEMCKKSCLTSSLKDFVSLIGDEEGLKTIPDSSRDDWTVECPEWSSDAIEDVETKSSCDSLKQKQTEFLKKKNSSFFDRLKEKLTAGNSEEQSLFCEICGHESKCLSEAVSHHKRHSDLNYKSELDGLPDSDIVLTGAELSSTRCQHCRQRCKTSTDLLNHLKSCKAFGAAYDIQSNLDELEKINLEELSQENDENVDEDAKSMENRVFVWNDLRQGHEGAENDEEEGEEEEKEVQEEQEEEEEEVEEDDDNDDEEDEEKAIMDVDGQSNEDFQMDTASVYGTVTSKGSDNTESGTLIMEIDPRLNLTVKKVFKCPHCSFWASTASRFHVHIVGHLNKKPFECSLCLYRSNWRWDITKHIRLKSARDPSHLEAQVNMTDETGRRNYSKYNKYLTMMKVQEPTAESSGTGRRSKPSEATQGNATDKDIIPLPAPPRLTRAPTPGTSHQVPQGVPLRPPPPLKAAHQLPTPVKLQTSTVNCFKDCTKKTLWKCKKCSFRDSNKSSVLAHVKEHYEKRKENSTNVENSSGLDFESINGTNGKTEPCGGDSIAYDTNFLSKPVTKIPSYKCGHCQQVSNWKHVIQRHCRLKHNGKALIQIGWREEPMVPSKISGESGENLEPTEDSVELISCDICPFTTDTEGDLTAHKLNHIDRPGSIFKCSYCPFYVPSKIAVLEHMEIHGINEGCKLTSLRVDNFDPTECNGDFSHQNNNNTGDYSKRYKCRQCPYLSNSRTQFLYHKQFHRPRDAPFKCMYCSYNVSRRHLLHQHLRVHHNQKEVSKTEILVEDDPEDLSATPNDLNTADMCEIPLVWVLKCGNFQKMFKCRWCPHVNMRKINIQEHEKMHQSNEKKTSSDTNQSSLKLQCPDCNYTCNNAGVLASHVKVHQGFYGEIRCLVDPSRPDADQIRELQSSLHIVEPEVVIKEEPDIELKNEENNKEKDVEELVSLQPEISYYHTSNENDVAEDNREFQTSLSFCNKCPARFFFKKELQIHSKFHMIHLPFRCSYCTYTARQKPHLLAHHKVHSQEYQQRSAELVKNYQVSTDYPQPKITVLKNDSQIIEGPTVWTVTLPEASTASSKLRERNYGKNFAKHACHRCPATFFKSVALQYHLSLHGGSYEHKCKYCDYTVKTYGNLIKHQLLHEEDISDGANKTESSCGLGVHEDDVHNKVCSIRLQAEDKHQVNGDESAKRTDPQFGMLIHGSPEFIYPTYLKNGKIKQKRYKCHKCPSAFEKRDQYRIHLSLHGSKQKYRCEKCDYSVKYYANYVQHMRKHQTHDEALKARNLEEFRGKFFTTRDSIDLTLLEKQTIFLQERKKSFDAAEDKKTYECLYCPYLSNRRDSVESHIKKHYRASKLKFGFQCPHCDYSTSQGNFLREHSKVHFGKSARYKAEAYFKCDQMELWCCEDSDTNATAESNFLVFQDKGESVEDRFYPSIDDAVMEEPNEWKFFVNPETGEPVEEGTHSLLKDSLSPVSKCQQQTNSEDYDSSSFQFHNEDLIEMVEESCKEADDKLCRQKPRPRAKRWRGKNWKCKKCPHAFGKRDQYMRHVALHGSNQRHNCDICDYSVKFYTNYVQHMRMHQMHEPDKIIFVKKNSQALDTSNNLTVQTDQNSQSDKQANLSDGARPNSSPSETTMMGHQESLCTVKDQILIFAPSEVIGMPAVASK